MSEYPNFDPSTPTLPEPYLIALGRVTYIWGLLESIVELAIAKFMGIEMGDPKSAVMITHLSWPQRMDMLESLANLYMDEYAHLQRFPQVKGLLKKAQEGRNKLLHNKLVHQEGRVLMITLSSRGKLKHSVVTISTNDIESVFLDIGNASTELLKIVLNK
jgi:hypothetical protein